MKELLSHKERDQVLERIKKQKFSATRRNVASWCMQWFALVFSALWFVFYFGKAEFKWTPYLFLGLAFLLVALLNHLRWERYKEQFVLREMIEKSSEQPDEPYKK